MPRVEKIAVTFGCKLNLGNYQSGTVETSAWVELDAEDDPAAAFDQYFKMCRDAARREAARMLAKNPPEVKT